MPHSDVFGVALTFCISQVLQTLVQSEIADFMFMLSLYDCPDGSVIDHFADEVRRMSVESELLIKIKTDDHERRLVVANQHCIINGYSEKWLIPREG